MQYWFKLLFNSQGKRLYIGILLAYCTAMSGIALLMLSGWFITATALTGTAIAAGIVIKFDMYLPGSGIRFFALSRTISGYVERLYNHDNVLRAIGAFRLSAFKGLTELSAQKLRSTSDSEWLGKLTADLDALDSLLLKYVIPPAALILSLITLSIFISFFWFELAFVFGAFSLLLTVLMLSLTIGQTKALAHAKSVLLSQLRADVITHLQGAFELNVSEMMREHEEHILARLESFNDVQNRLNRKIGNLQLLLDSTLALSLVGLLSSAMHAVNINLIDGPVAVMLVLLLLGISELIQSIVAQFSSWGQTQFAATRLVSLVHQSPNLKQTENTAANLVNIESIDSLKLLINKHPKIASSLAKTIDISVEDQDLILITGRSGSGKSSLASALAQKEVIDRNIVEITINHKHCLNEISSEMWYQNLGVVEQQNRVLSGTLRYNLDLGLEAKSDEQLQQVLQALELWDWAKNLENGLDTWLGETGASVSGGQARRLNIARVLLREPQLVILDEPFNGLDANMTARIWSKMELFLRKRKVILLMHEAPDFVAHYGAFKSINLDTD
jgi:ATP-binding cassette subfamily C protein CydC